MTLWPGQRETYLVSRLLTSEISARKCIIAGDCDRDAYSDARGCQYPKIEHDARHSR